MFISLHLSSVRFKQRSNPVDTGYNQVVQDLEIVATPGGKTVNSFHGLRQSQTLTSYFSAIDGSKGSFCIKTLVKEYQNDCDQIFKEADGGMRLLQRYLFKETRFRGPS